MRHGPCTRGERLRVRGRLTHALGPVNFGTAGLEDYYRARGVCSALRAESGDVEYLGRRAWSPYYWAARIRAWETRALHAAGTGIHAALPVDGMAGRFGEYRFGRIHQLYPIRHRPYPVRIGRAYRYPLLRHELHSARVHSLGASAGGPADRAGDAFRVDGGARAWPACARR